MKKAPPFSAGFVICTRWGILYKNKCQSLVILHIENVPIGVYNKDTVRRTETKGKKKMKEYKLAQITKYRGEWILVNVKNFGDKESKSINISFKTKKQALSHFKCFYAPLRTTRVVLLTGDTYEAIYEAPQK